MSGTGRRRKPPVGEEGEPSTYQGAESYQGAEPYQGTESYQGAESFQGAGYGAQAQSQPQPQWQTYAPPPEPQYDYDWRTAQPAAGTQSAAGTPTSPAPGTGARAAAGTGATAGTGNQPAAESWPPQYQQPYQEYQIPQPRWEQPSPAAYVDPDPIAPQPVRPPVAPSAPTPSVPYAPTQTAPSVPSAPPGAGVEPGAASVFSRPQPRPEPADPAFEFEFDEEEPPAASVSGTRPAVGRPADKDGYRPDDFAFVDEADEPDVKGWLEFSESRADARAERMRRMRTRLIALAAVLVLAGAGFGAYTLIGGGTTTPVAAATKSLLLFQLDDAQGDSVGDALLVTKRDGAQDGSATGTGAVVIVPAKMRIQSDFGSQPFGGDMTGQPIQPPADDTEVAAALGVTPDGDLTLDETTFGIFVDELGGLNVAANADIPATKADPDGVKQGTSTLSGAQAVAYATYQAAGEADSAQAARFGQVVTALLAKLPTYGNAVSAQLNQLGLITKPSMPLSKLSPILAALAAQQAAGKVTEAVLPLSQDGSDTLNYTAAAPLVAKLLGGTMPAGASAGQAARVLVEDGTGLTGAQAQQFLADAEAKLQNAGYTFNNGSTAPKQDKTVVEVGSGSQQGLAEQVAAGLGLSGSAVKVVPGLSQVDDVTVILGADWPSLAVAP